MPLKLTNITKMLEKNLGGIWEYDKRSVSWYDKMSSTNRYISAVSTCYRDYDYRHSISYYLYEDNKPTRLIFFNHDGIEIL